MKKISVVMGASGAIGQEVVKALAADAHNTVFAFSRSGVPFNQDNVHSGRVDFDDEQSLESAAAQVARQGEPELVFIATGILHDNAIQPEKTIKNLSSDNMQALFHVNTVGPAMVMKHFLPIMPKSKPYVIASLSARVGSISDNALGGWYSYRASKAALNMIIKTTSIEATRINKQSIIIGLQPGTVDSALSKPFQAGVPESKLFDPHFSATKMLSVIETLKAQQTGKMFAWDGEEIGY